MERWIQDLRYGVRILARNPGFAAIAILSLALGIGVNTSIFPLVNAALLRPLPVDNPERIVSLRGGLKGGSDSFNLSYPMYQDLQERGSVFTGLAAARFVTVNLSTSTLNERIWGYLASGNYFELLGVKAALGRTFTEAEDRAEGADPFVVLSFDYWRTRFASDPAIVGKSVRLNGHPFMVIGIAPEDFNGTEIVFAPDFWVPMMMQEQADPGSNWLHNRNEGRLNQVIARLKRGVGMAQAQAQMDTVSGEIAKDYPSANGATQVINISRPGFFVPQFRSAVITFGLLLLAIGGLVILLACTNLAGLLLARCAERRKEIAVRLAIGAGRARLVRQLLTESLLISAAGGAAALMVAIGVNKAFTTFRPPLDFPINLAVPTDYRVLAFTVGVAILTCILFGLVPALQASRPALVTALKEESGGSTRSRLRNLLVAGQVALSLILLCASALVLRSLMNAQNMDVGFDSRSALEVSFDLGLQGYEPAARERFFTEALRRVTALPGVEAAGLAEYLPLALDSSTRGVRVDGYTPGKGESPNVLYARITPGYFQAMGIPILRGRDFSTSDDAGAPPVIIVNEAFVRRYWPGQDGVGKQAGVNGAGRPASEIVGVVKDGKYISLGEAPRPFVYISAAQETPSHVTMVMRTKADPHGTIGPVRSEFQALDPHLPLYDVKSLGEHMSTTLLPARLAAGVLLSFGFLALALAAVGVYGLTLNVVTQRTREVGIRMALGATRREIVQLVLRQGMALATAGIAVGLIATLALARILSSLLYGVSATDPRTLAAAAIGLSLLVAFASYVPARRAMRIDPTEALKRL
jgi:putative ABC transport system permease protein